MKKTNLKRITCLVCTVFILLYSSSQLHAAGLYFPGVGANALARGGAFIASGDDVTSIAYNPANLSRLKGFQLLNTNALLFSRMQYQRATHPQASNPFPPVHNTASPHYVPFLGLSYDWGILQLPQSHRIVIAAGFWSAYRSPSKWDDNQDQSAQPDCALGASQRTSFHCEVQGPQRYTAIREALQQTYFSFALGYVLRLPTVKLRLGGSFYLIRTDFQKLFTAKTAPDSTHHAQNDVTLQLNTQSSFSTSGNVGFSLELPQGVGIGVSFRAPFTVNTDGTLKIQEQHFANLLKGDRILMRFEIPWSLRAGLSWRPSFFKKRFLAEMAAVYEPWSVHNKVKFQSPPGSKQIVYRATNQPFPSFEVPKEYLDTWSLRLGFQVDAIEERLLIRFGWLYETSSIAQSTFSVADAQGEHHTITLGVEGRIPVGPVQIVLNVSYAHSIYPDVLVQTSTHRAWIFRTPNIRESTGDNIGTGTYQRSSSLLLFSAAFLLGS